MQGKLESFQTSPLRLAMGQSHFEAFPRGTVIRVSAGSVALVQRTALDSCTLAQQTRLPRGAVHCVQMRSWVQIVAQSDAQVVVMVPQAVSLGRELRVWWMTVRERCANGVPALLVKTRFRMGSKIPN